jgi:RNA polymerase sigma factor (sigma-70 family)
VEVSLAQVLVKDALAGDEQAFVLLVEPLLPAAYRLAVGMLRNESEAEDAVQESVFKAWRSFGRFRKDSDLKPWLFTIVANECRRQRRSRWWNVIKQPGRWSRRPHTMPPTTQRPRTCGWRCTDCRTISGLR